MHEQPQPITMQPVQSQGNLLQSIINNSPFLNECPPGMQSLIPTSAIIVKQQIEILEVLTGYETANKYDVLDFNGMRMFLAAEEPAGFCAMQCLGASRLFNIDILDNTGRAYLLINRTDSSICCNCSGNSVKVSTANREYIGQITQVENTMNPMFSIKDNTDTEQLRVVGPCCCCICGDVSFQVQENGKQIGEIHKEWGGYMKEQYTAADTFGVTFPMELHPKLKCLLLGAVFLIDFMFFENQPNYGCGGCRR